MHCKHFFEYPDAENYCVLSNVISDKFLIDFDTVYGGEYAETNVNMYFVKV
jgi:hypothetical protein